VSEYAVGRPLADDLRTRIAAVLDGYVDHGHRYDLADAVIRELQLHRESDNHHGDGTTLRHRYVTEWEQP